MVRWTALKPDLDRRLRPEWTLCLLWCLGLGLGYGLAAAHGGTLSQCLRLAAGVPALDSAGFTVLLPLALACMAALTVPACCLALCLGRGFLVGLMLGASLGAFPGCPVLGGFLVLFSRICFSPVLFWYWSRRLTPGGGFLIRDSILCSGMGAAICGIDIWLISPFLVRIINF